jgi:hypothetical protein
MVDADESGASVSFTKSLEYASGAVLWADKDAQTRVTQMKSRLGTTGRDRAGKLHCWRPSLGGFRYNSSIPRVCRVS